MTALAAADMDVKIKVLDPTLPAPAAVAADQIIGSFREEDRIREFAKGCDVITFEIEHVDVDAVEKVREDAPGDSPGPVHCRSSDRSSHVYGHSKDRIHTHNP